MTTTSTATPTQWGDNSEFELNGTVQDGYNDKWTNPLMRWGIYDLKAPDVDLRGAFFRFTNLAPEIPPNAIIESATITGGAFPNAGLGSGRTPFDAFIEIVAKDGLWDADPVSATAWRRCLSSTYEINTGIAIYTSAPTLLAKTNLDPPFVGVLSKGVGIRQWGAASPSVGRNEKFGSVMRATATGTLDNAKIVMYETGTATGNCWLEVWSVVGGIPSALLATSDTRLSSSMSPSANPLPVESFTFTAGPTITSGSDYAVVLAKDGPDDLVNVLRVAADTGPKANTYAVAYGEGAGVCFGNYISAGDVEDLAVVPGSGSVSWPLIPAWVENSAQSTPDISSLIQAYVSGAGYAQGDPFLLRIRQLDPLQLAHRGFKTWQNTDTPGLAQYPTLEINWRRRRIGIL